MINKGTERIKGKRCWENRCFGREERKKNANNEVFLAMKTNFKKMRRERKTKIRENMSYGELEI